MAPRKAWYWLAAGMLALGINSEYQSGKFEFLHRYVDHSLTVADAYARCAGRYLAQAHLLLALTQHNSTQPVFDNSELADVHVLATQQVRYALAQAQMARQQVELQRPELEKALAELRCQRARLASTQRLATNDDFRGLVICPGNQHIRVAVPQVRIPHVIVAVPPIHVAVPSVNVEVPAVNVEVPAVRVQVPPVHVSAMDDSDNTL